MTGTTNKTWLVRMVILGLFVAALVAVWQIPGLRPRDVLLRLWQRRLEKMPDESLAGPVEQLAALDEAALSQLVDALGSGRLSLSRAADDALNRLLDRWQSLPVSQSSRRVSLLARYLAERVDRFGPAAQEAANRLAMRLLQWPRDDAWLDQPALLAACQKVLKRTADRMESMRSSPARGESADGTEVVAVPRRAAVGPDAVESSPSDLPGGNLPWDAVQLPPLPPSLAALPEPRPVEGDLPQLTQPPEPSAPRELFTDERAKLRAPANLVPSDVAAPTPSVSAESAPGGLLPTPRRPTAKPLELQGDREVIRQLASPDAAAAQAAESELLRRGYQQTELRMARQLASPEPVTRRHLAESLPKQAVDPRRWLLWLSRDPDAEVRKTAVALIATARDPSLQARLHELEDAEDDQQVREQLRRWSQADTKLRR